MFVMEVFEKDALDKGGMAEVWNTEGWVDTNIRRGGGGGGEWLKYGILKAGLIRIFGQVGGKGGVGGERN